MCGRYALKTSLPEIARILGMEVVDPIIQARETDRAKYNIAPTQEVLACRRGDAGRELTFLRWGLIPYWSKSDKHAYRMINARAETVAEKPAFRTALKQRRCLIPTDGFYEWQNVDGVKTPYFICMRDRAPFFFAAGF